MAPRYIISPVGRFSERVENDADLLSALGMGVAGVYLVAAEDDDATVRQSFVHVRVKHEIGHQFVSLPPILLAHAVVVVQVRRAPRAFHLDQQGESEKARKRVENELSRVPT